MMHMGFKPKNTIYHQTVDIVITFINISVVQITKNLVERRMAQIILVSHQAAIAFT
jgi:hypothetical protein